MEFLMNIGLSPMLNEAKWANIEQKSSDLSCSLSASDIFKRAWKEKKLDATWKNLVAMGILVPCFL